MSVAISGLAVTKAIIPSPIIAGEKLAPVGSVPSALMEAR